MHVLSIGLNHTTAPVEIRERAAVTESHLEEALRDIRNCSSIEEATILSTCNRTEVYCQLKQQDVTPVSNWLCDYHEMDRAEVQPFLYAHPNQEAVKHAFRVASGLDSMVLGEPQILGQMKTAFAKAHKNGNTGKILNRLFQHTFSVAKEVRSTTEIGNNAVSVAYAGVSLAKQIFADLSEQTVMLVGAGETIELCCRHLYAQGVRKIIVANRTLERAQRLHAEFGVEAISLHELPMRLTEADMVFSSTASTLPILGKGAFESALRKRKNSPMLVIDLAIPRDVETEVGDLSSVYLYTIDDLQQVVDENLVGRQEAAKQAEKIVDNQAIVFMDWLSNLQSLPTIRQLRNHTSAITDSELAHARRRLQAGDDPAVVLELFAHAISQKFMHQPTETLRHKNDDALLDAAKALFGLNDAD